jgi:hypothetical protein
MSLHLLEINLLKESFEIPAPILAIIDIKFHSFNLIDEIQKIDPVLWNFIYRLTANEQEEKMLRQSWFKWDTLHW